MKNVKMNQTKNMPPMQLINFNQNFQHFFCYTQALLQLNLSPNCRTPPPLRECPAAQLRATGWGKVLADWTSLPQEELACFRKPWLSDLALWRCRLGRAADVEMIGLSTGNPPMVTVRERREQISFAEEEVSTLVRVCGQAV